MHNREVQAQRDKMLTPRQHADDGAASDPRRAAAAATSPQDARRALTSTHTGQGNHHGPQPHARRPPPAPAQHEKPLKTQTAHTSRSIFASTLTSPRRLPTHRNGPCC